MKRSLLFTAVLCGMLTAASAMAEDVRAAAPAIAGDVSTDFHALSAMSSPVPVMTETQMASVEGGISIPLIPGILTIELLPGVL